MNDEQPTQPLTDAELATIRKDVESNTPACASVTRAILFHEVVRLRSALTALGRNEQAAANRSLELQEERSEMLSDLQWYISDLGPEHWQHCDVGDEDCYLCAGHVAIRDRWKGVE